MDFEAIDFLEYLEKPINSKPIADGIKILNLSEVEEDLPFRCYVGSSALGFSLLFHDENLIDLQFFVKPTPLYKKYLGSLPYGIIGSMKQSEVHNLLGHPIAHDPTFSRFLLNDRHGEAVRLSVEYDKDGNIRYISAARPH